MQRFFSFVREKQYEKRKGSFWFMVSEASLCRCLGPLFLSSNEAEYQGRERSKVAPVMAASRDEGTRDKIFLSGTHLQCPPNTAAL